MQYLIDTHVLIWYIEGNKRLPKNIREILNDENNTVVVSIISLLELTIKLTKPKDKIGFNITLAEFESHIFERDFMLLDITFEHLHVMQKLPLHHGDPFDRLLISQAIAEDLPMITEDGKFINYPLYVIW